MKISGFEALTALRAASASKPLIMPAGTLAGISPAYLSRLERGQRTVVPSVAGMTEIPARINGRVRTWLESRRRRGPVAVVVHDIGDSGGR